MSHSTTIGATTFIHNGDYSGPVEIRHGKGATEVRFEVPCPDVLGFAAEVIRSERIKILEGTERTDLLFGAESMFGSPQVEER